MSLSLFVLWTLAGWCITGSPRLWLRRWYREPVPHPPDPYPEPPPYPWLVAGIVGAIGGVIGGLVFTQVFGSHPVPWISAGPSPDPWMPVVYAAASTVGAFLGGRLAIDFYWLVSGGGNVPRA
jgi:hypothetical protein